MQVSIISLLSSIILLLFFGMLMANEDKEGIFEKAETGTSNACDYTYAEFYCKYKSGCTLGLAREWLVAKSCLVICWLLECLIDLSFVKQFND